MEAVVAGVVGVIGTLLGAALTHRFQQRSAATERADRLAEARRQELLHAAVDVAAAASRLKRAVVTLRLADLAGGAASELFVDADRSGAEAEAARFRLDLLGPDAGVLDAADAALAAAGSIRRAADRDALVEEERVFEALLHGFTAATRAEIAAVHRS